MKVPRDIDGVPSTRIPVKHESHLPNVMFFTAVARPDAHCNGLLSLQGIGTVTGQVQRRLPPHGHLGPHAPEWDKDHFFELTKKVMEQIWRKMKRCKVVTVPMDNARPHLYRPKL